MNVFFSINAEKKLLDLCEYLLEEWGYKVKQDFIKKFKKKVFQISQYPESCTKSKKN